MAAIYMWIVNEEVIVTTTPYPLENTEGSNFSVNLAVGILREIHNTNFGFTTVALQSEMTTVLNERTANPSEFSFTTVAIESEMTTILNERTADPSEFSFEILPLDGVMETQLVTIEAPPRGAEFSVILGNCTMDAV